jgi:hypothetical protein
MIFFDIDLGGVFDIAHGHRGGIFDVKVRGVRRCCGPRSNRQQRGGSRGNRQVL